MRATLPNSSRSASVAFAVALAASVSACGTEGPPAGELREWRPSDHQLPEGYDEAAAEQQAATAADPGAALYATHCASCHGLSGRGDGPGAPPMARVPTFVDPAIQARTDEQLAEVIVQGRGGFMPAFGDRLPATGVAAIVRHLRSFGP
jgi:mono/diheme cytochrome c family protein